jgi:hypothetical protein
MSKLVAVMCVTALLAGCGLTEPTLESFVWSRDSLPPAEFSQFDEPIPLVDSAGREVIQVWSTTYSRQDMSKARGWIETNPSEVTLCFEAPDFPPVPPALDTAEAAAAYPTLLTYRLAGQNGTSNVRFGGTCNGP